GQVGAHWDVIGWRVDVHFTLLSQQIRPVEHMDRLRPFLPTKYAPLQPNGDRLQAVYLTVLHEPLAAQLIDLIGTEARAVAQNWTVGDSTEDLVLVGQTEWEEHQVDQLKATPGMSETEKKAIV